MSIPATPTSFYTTQADGRVLVQWALSSGATSYVVQRSTDQLTYTTVASPSTTSFVDATAALGTAYWYQVASVNASGTSPYAVPQSVVPSPAGEMCLGELRTRAQNRADRLNSDFVTLPEWNFFINQAMFELYDLLVTEYEDYFIAPPVSFTSDGSTFLYPLPNGVLTFTDQGGNPTVASPFYKLQGVDLSINTAQNAYVTVNKFNFINRNTYIYPNSSGSLYGVFNMQYRLLGNQIEFVPTPSAGQNIRLWYVPRMVSLLQDTDLTTQGVSGWLQYVIVRAAKYALDKEESPTDTLTEELLFLKGRIEDSAMNRDAGQPNTISDIRSTKCYGEGGGGYSGPIGGW